MSSKPITHRVDPDRLAPGIWSEEFNRHVGEGDIARAYSADTIGMNQAIREPFIFRGYLWTSVCLSGGVARAYQLVPIEDFLIDEVTGQEPVEDWDARRSNELGYYHGVVARFRMDWFVFSGPPVFFEPGGVVHNRGCSQNQTYHPPACLTDSSYSNSAFSNSESMYEFAFRT